MKSGVLTNAVTENISAIVGTPIFTNGNSVTLILYFVSHWGRVG